MICELCHALFIKVAGTTSARHKLESVLELFLLYVYKQQIFASRTIFSSYMQRHGVSVYQSVTKVI